MSKRKRSILEDKWAADEGAAGDEDSTENVQAAGSADAAAGSGDEAERLRHDVQALREQLLRKQAELVNFRRRTERERQERLEAERAAVVRELLPVVDDFERAVAAELGDADEYRRGVELILRSLHDSLSRLGVERIEPQGEPFDPHLHEAVDRRETQEVAAGHVAVVYKPGYRLGERLVRAAVVAVAASPGEDPERSDDDGR